MQEGGRFTITLMTEKLFPFSLKVIITVNIASQTLSIPIRESLGEKILKGLMQLESNYPSKKPP